MIRRLLFFCAALLLVQAIGAVGTSVHAQSVENKSLLGSYNDWDAWRARYSDGSVVCFMLSEVEDWSASRKNVRRGDIYTIVSHRPEADVRDEVNVVVGYPFKEGSTATAVIDGSESFEMFTKGDGAWNYDSQADKEMVAAMKKGLKLVVRGTSSRGTRTTDTYSLSGFTAAHNAISDACRM